MNNKIDGMSMDIEKSNLDKLRSVFPDCVVEGKLDIDKLMSLCGEYVDNDFEKYKFEWKGKAEGLRLAQKRSSGTLRPCVEESVDFDTTKNLYIEGDNLEVLKLLQTAYYRKVKMIYIDPPYNTGNDFVYEDDFADPMAKYKEITGQATKSNPETAGRYHTNWLNMMYPRLRLASNLLTDDGVIFISIDDNEVDNLKKICNEVFGEENFVASLIDIRSEGGGLAKQAVIGHDYVLVYAKSLSSFVPLGKPKDIRGKVVEIGGEDYWIETDWLRKEFGKYGTCPYEEIIQWLGEKKKEEIDKGIEQGKFVLIEKEDYHIVGRYRKVADDTSKFYTIIKHLNKHGVDELKKLNVGQYFDFPKPLSLLKELILGATIKTKNKEDIILDFFSGSATTAHAVMQLNAEDGGNRKFICVQIPELTDVNSEAYKAGYSTICEIGKERIRRAGAKTKADSPLTTMELDTGFKVFKLDTSNLTEWDGQVVQGDDLIELTERMNKMVEGVKNDRTELDVITEIMLKMGIPLDMDISQVEINGKMAYVVGDYLLLICLANNVTAEDISTMCDLSPAKLIVAESSFADSVVLSNAYYILKDKQIDMELV